MGEFRDRGGEAVWAGIEQKSQYGAENKKRRDTAASRRLVGLSIWQFAQKGGVIFVQIADFLFLYLVLIMQVRYVLNSCKRRTAGTFPKLLN